MSQLDFIRVKDPERIAELAIFAEGIFREYFSTLHEPEKVDYLVSHLLSIETLTTAIADEGYEYYFVDDEQTGEHVGFIGIRPDDGFLYLSKLYLIKDARGKGLGRAEFEFVKQRAQDLGLGRIRAHVRARQHREPRSLRSHGVQENRLASTMTLAAVLR